MTEPAATSYDVFISYSRADQAWVWQWLIPRLKDAGLKVCTDRDFAIGAPQVENISRAIDASRHVLLVLTPAWVESQWRLLEGMLTITADPAARLRKLLPLVLAPCQPPEHIAHLSYADFADEAGREEQFRRVIAAALGELTLPDIGPQLARLGSVPSAPFLVPFPHNPDFVGRDEDLAHLHGMIAGSSSPVGIRPTVLVGLGGIGKTQLAVEYAHAQRANYPGGIYWVNAINPLLGELAGLAEQLGLASIETPRDRAVQTVWQYLDARPEALVIFDNVVEPSTLNLPVALGLTPANLRCRTLFTTRQRDFPRNFQPFEVKVLPEAAAMRLLLRARPEVLEEHHREWGQARVLCAYLGWLPLALELAAAYLGAYPEVTVAGYLERLRVEGRLATIDDTEVTAADLPTRYHEIAALVRQDLAAQHRIAVQATLETQWRRLDDDASRLLFCAAGQFVEASWISIARLSVLTGVATEAGPGRPSPLTQALRKLHEISLIEDLSREQLRLHPLVQEFAASSGDDGLQQEMVGRVLRTYESFETMEAQVARRGIDQVIGDLRAGLRLCRDSKCDGMVSKRLQDLERTLDREAHALRSWNSNLQTALFAQQIYKRAAVDRLPHLAASARQHLTTLHQPHFVLEWRAGHEAPELERTLSRHQAAVRAVAATPNGRQAISASSDHTLKIWDLASGQEERTLAGHGGWVHAVAVAPDGQRAVSASEDYTLKVWNLASGQEERILAGHEAGVRAVAVTPDGQRAISASSDHTLKVWDLFSGQETLVLRGHLGSVNAVAVHPDGRYVISASEDRKLKVWDLVNGREDRTLAGHGGWVRAVTVTPDGRRVISASDDHTLKVWDLANGQEEYTLSGHDSKVFAVTVTQDGRWAISASEDRTLRVWDLTRRRQVRTLIGHSDCVHGVTVVGPDERRVISASFDRTLKIWDISALLDVASATSQDVHTHAGHDAAVLAMTVTLDGQRAISGSFDRTLKVWDTSKLLKGDMSAGREVRTLAGHDAAVRAVAVTPDGRQVVSASSDRTIKVWDMLRSAEERTLVGHSAGVSSVVVTPDGRRVISASSDHTLKVWDLTQNQEERTLIGHGAGVWSIALTPDGRRVISASSDRTLKIWDLAAGREERTLAGHSDRVRAVAVTPDGQRVVSASSDRTLKIWDLATGQQIRTLAGHASRVFAVVVTVDGRRVISASEDRTLRVWDMETGHELFLIHLEATLNCLVVLPDGMRVLTGDQAGNIYCLKYVEAKGLDHEEDETRKR